MSPTMYIYVGICMNTHICTYLKKYISFIVQTQCTKIDHVYTVVMITQRFNSTFYLTY